MASGMWENPVIRGIDRASAGGGAVARANIQVDRGVIQITKPPPLAGRTGAHDRARPPYREGCTWAGAPAILTIGEPRQPPVSQHGIPGQQ